MTADLGERVVLWPGRCADCGDAVAYMMVGQVHKGWLHPSGLYRCAWTIEPTDRKAYNREWMRRHRKSKVTRAKLLAASHRPERRHR